MKFDLEWLTDHLRGKTEPDTLAESLTACGFLVELRETVDSSEVWDVEVTTNRPDAMNHRGLAREAAAATGVELGPLQIELVESDEPAAELASIQIADPELCGRYVARVVRGIRIVRSPEWLQRRLARCGVRPINAVVDATNYVLLELGQPLHAFDLDRLAERSIVVRRATDGEMLVTLDEQQRTLTKQDLVIADEEHAVALAGIMGGGDAEISEDTRDVLIESAHFDPLTVRRTARRLGMHTEASHRFERGSDPEMAAIACDAVAALIARLAGGSVSSGRIDAYPRPFEARQLTFSTTALSAFAGLDIEPADVERILNGLEFAAEVDGDRVSVTVPSHRVDVERIPDLYEEVLRHVGYGEVPSQLPVLSTPPGHRHANWELVDRGRGAAVAAGLTEVMTWAFIDPDDDAAVDDLPLCPGRPLALANPLSSTQATMRRSLLPGLLAAARETLNQGERSLALFEQGRVFCAADGTPREEERIGVLMSGVGSDGRFAGFADLKGIVEAVLDRAAFAPVSWSRGGAPWLDETEGALVSSQDHSVVGYAGLLATSFADRWGLKQLVYVAELDLGAALPKPPLAQFQALQRYPSVVADMTVEHPMRITFAELVGVVRELATDRVEAVELKDRYSGETLRPDTVRTTLRLIYRHPERSLTQEEVNADQTTLRERLAERLGVGFA
jgi:phenylalanyl-tRNA synthetase beta chain